MSAPGDLHRRDGTSSHPVIHLAVGILIGGLFLYVSFRGTDVDALLASITTVNYWWILAGFVCLLVSHSVRAHRWGLMLNPLKPRIPALSLLSGLFQGYAVNNVLPRAGELVRPFVVARREGLALGGPVGTIVFERIVDTLTLLLLLALVPVVYRGPVMQSFPALAQAGRIATVVTVCALAAAVVFVVRRDWTDRALRAVDRLVPLRIRKRLDRQVHAFLDAGLVLTSVGSLARFLLFTVLVWGLYVLMFYCGLEAYPLDPSVGFQGAFVVLAISSIGVVLPSPGGTGTYHAFASRTLSGLFGVEPTLALSFATITHAVNYIGVSLIGLLFFLHEHVKLREILKPEEGRDP